MGARPEGWAGAAGICMLRLCIACGSVFVGLAPVLHIMKGGAMPKQTFAERHDAYTKPRYKAGKPAVKGTMPSPQAGAVLERLLAARASRLAPILQG